MLGWTPEPISRGERLNILLLPEAANGSILSPVVEFDNERKDFP